MKIKQEIEWVVGELPETESLKLVAIVCDGTTIAMIGYYSKKEKVWYRDDERFIDSQVVAWAKVPLFGVPASSEE